jgi:hypothetical protein
MGNKVGERYSPKLGHEVKEWETQAPPECRFSALSRKIWMCQGDFRHREMAHGVSRFTRAN